MRTAFVYAILLVIVVICCGCTTTTPSSAPSTGTAPPATVAITPLSTTSPSGGTGASFPIRIRDNSFDPDFVTVKEGTTVIWTNEDPGTHTITYTGNDAMKFDSGPLANGQSFSNTFTAVGRYTYTCKQHSFMTGTIVVR